MNQAKANRYLLFFYLIFVAVFFLLCNFKFSLTVGPDFRAYYNAMMANNAGLNMYDINDLNFIAKSKSNGVVLPYLYPPITTTLLAPLSGFKVETANYIWNLLSFLLLILVFYLSVQIALFSLQDQDKQQKTGVHDLFVVVAISLLLFFLFPFENNFWKGQVNVVVLAFIVLSLYFLFCKPKYYLSGFFLSVAFLLKVTPVILIVVLIKKGKLKTLIGFAGGVCLLFLLSIATNGIGMWKDFVDFMPRAFYGQTPPGLFSPQSVYNFSLAGFFSRLCGNNPSLISKLTVVAVLALIGIAYFLLAGKKSSALFMVPLFLIIMVISAPYAYLYQIIYLFPGLLLVLSKMYFKLADFEKLFYSGILIILSYIVGTDCTIFYDKGLHGLLFQKLGTSIVLYCLLLMFVVIIVYFLRSSDNRKEVS